MRQNTSELASYHDLIAAKRIAFTPRGFSDVSDKDILPGLFDHQRHGVEFALRSGAAATFFDTGLGKTAIALSWGNAIVRRTNRPVLMLAPLAVGAQHIKEANRLGVEAVSSRTGEAPPKPCIAVTNYERLERFDAADYAGVILDESSILKSYTGKTTRKLIESFARTPYRLACTATPAPNDHTELGQHSEFLGSLSQTQMLTRWFLHDSADTGTWRLKGHAVGSFWDWVASWARCVSRPSDLGFSDSGFEMPALEIKRHLVDADRSQQRGEEKDGQHRLLRLPDTSATSIHKEKRLTKEMRADKVAQILAAEPAETWIVWCDTDYDADALKAVLPDAIEVSGSMSIEMKEARLTAFSAGEIRVLITKPSVAGFGLNWQHCARMAFMGLSFSYESFYQAVRRCWRFRQVRPVAVHVVCADTESAIFNVISRKAGDHEAMKLEMSSAMKRAYRHELALRTYEPTVEACLPAWMNHACA